MLGIGYSRGPSVLLLSFGVGGKVTESRETSSTVMLSQWLQKF